MIPKDTWGTVQSGDMAGGKVVVTGAENGGWDILIVPPPPSTMPWNYWADDEEQVAAFFQKDAVGFEDAPWVWPGLLPDVAWNDEPPPEEHLARYNEPDPQQRQGRRFRLRGRANSDACDQQVSAASDANGKRTGIEIRTYVHGKLKQSNAKLTVLIDGSKLSIPFGVTFVPTPPGAHVVSAYWRLQLKFIRPSIEVDVPNDGIVAVRSDAPTFIWQRGQLLIDKT